MLSLYEQKGGPIGLVMAEKSLNYMPGTSLESARILLETDRHP